MLRKSWDGRVGPDLRMWMLQQGYIQHQDDKPDRPKEAVEKALRIVMKPRSSSIYYQLATMAGLSGHDNRSFIKLKTNLREWFPR